MSLRRSRAERCVLALARHARWCRTTSVRPARAVAACWIPASRSTASASSSSRMATPNCATRRHVSLPRCDRRNRRPCPASSGRGTFDNGWSRRRQHAICRGELFSVTTARQDDASRLRRIPSSSATPERARPHRRPSRRRPAPPSGSAAKRGTGCHVGRSRPPACASTWRAVLRDGANYVARPRCASSPAKDHRHRAGRPGRSSISTSPGTAGTTTGLGR